jgi:wyosine [tRNA(Phe)-imidazoG37] synthetase (radical SAM superfamily)
MLQFARTYAGDLATETMLVRNLNDSAEHVQGVADFLACLRPHTAYLSIPTRPPAEEWARAPEEALINRAYQILRTKLHHVEYLIGYEGNAFAFTGHVHQDLLSITAVHPMRREAVDEFLERAGADWSAIHQLVESGQLIETPYEGRMYYMRKLH